MAKTYQNKQLLPGEFIKNSYTKMNDNSSQVDNDLTDLYKVVVYKITDTGLANAYVGTLVNQAIFVDMYVLLKPLNDNTGNSTFNYGSSGVKNIVQINNGVKVNLQPKDIREERLAMLIYDGVDWVLLNGKDPESNNLVISNTAPQDTTVAWLDIS